MPVTSSGSANMNAKAIALRVERSMSLTAMSNAFITSSVAQLPAGQVQEYGFQVWFMDTHGRDPRCVLRGGLEQPWQRSVAIGHHHTDHTFLGGHMADPLRGAPGLGDLLGRGVYGQVNARLLTHQLDQFGLRPQRDQLALVHDADVIP